MANIGCLGDIPFVVSDKMVQTINNIQWSGSSRYATHQRHLTDTLTEFVGNNPDRFTCDLVLNAYLGADPMGEINKLWAYMRNAAPVSLVIGDKAYGKYRWSIIDIRIKVKTMDRIGNLTSATVSVTLQEYMRS